MTDSLTYSVAVAAVAVALHRSPQWVHGQCRRLLMGHYEGRQRRLTAADVVRLAVLAHTDGRVRRARKERQPPSDLSVMLSRVLRGKVSLRGPQHS